MRRGRSRRFRPQVPLRGDGRASGSGPQGGARSRRPRCDNTKRVRGSLDVPVRVGGTTLGPGDVVVLDADGGVVVARDRVADVAAAATARIERESGLRARLAAGAHSYDLHGMRAEDESAG
ncbi:hypothetical protein D7147_10265 [Micromonospora musae]|uniref:Oxaloacetate decarboxylase n=1 Tax=Micromonospora musae TaxID=1894970 RepID=A0ABX9RC50_9ACTN|nr:hypothetical protein D7147_10265 [Micromonospora musae]